MQQQGLARSLEADYRALYKHRPDPPRLGRLVAALRFVTNPSLHAVVLLRITNSSPHWIAWFFRSLLISRFSIDWGMRCELGPGLALPHPFGIAVSGRIGSDVRLLHNVTLAGTGRDSEGRERLPVIGDGAQILTGAVVAGVSVGERALIGAHAYVGAPVGERAIIGANAFVNRPVPPRAVVRSVSETLEAPKAPADTQDDASR